MKALLAPGECSHGHQLGPKKKHIVWRGDPDPDPDYGQAGRGHPAGGTGGQATLVLSSHNVCI